MSLHTEIIALSSGWGFPEKISCRRLLRSSCSSHALFSMMSLVRLYSAKRRAHTTVSTFSLNRFPVAPATKSNSWRLCTHFASANASLVSASVKSRCCQKCTSEPFVTLVTSLPCHSRVTCACFFETALVMLACLRQNFIGLNQPSASAQSPKRSSRRGSPKISRTSRSGNVGLPSLIGVCVVKTTFCFTSATASLRDNPVLRYFVNNSGMTPNEYTSFRQYRSTDPYNAESIATAPLPSTLH